MLAPINDIEIGSDRAERSLVVSD